MQTYTLSPTGRRTTLVLLLAALAIWAFAIWSFRSTLGADVNPFTFRALPPEGLSISQIVPALLMLVLIIATPFLIWNLLEEWAARYTPIEEGLRFESLGVSLLYPWDSMTAIRTRDADSDDPFDEVLLSRSSADQIKNPLLRFLHVQAYGSKRLPIYSGLANRDDLLALIRERAGIAADTATGEAEPVVSAEQAKQQDVQV